MPVLDEEAGGFGAGGDAGAAAEGAALEGGRRGGEGDGAAQLPAAEDAEEEGAVEDVAGARRVLHRDRERGLVPLVAPGTGVSAVAAGRDDHDTRHVRRQGAGRGGGVGAAGAG